MDTVSRNVVIAFNSSLTDEFIRFSQAINLAVPSQIVLNTYDQIPHLTLYMTKYPMKNIPKVLEGIEQVANEIQSFNIFFNTKTCHTTGTIFIDPQMSNDLLNLHSRLVDGLNPLREGLYNEDELNLPGRDDRAKMSLINYGVWAVKEDYKPHVSVGRVTDPEKEGPIALTALPEDINYQALVEEICFAERGPNGTCKKILETFQLRG